MALRRRARPAAIPTDRHGALAVLAAAVVTLTLAACTAGATPDDPTTAPSAARAPRAGRREAVVRVRADTLTRFLRGSRR